MTKIFARTLLLAASVTAVAAANAITFTSVNITGPASLIAGSGFSTGLQDIDFTFVSAVVGDALPLRSGTINLTYVAESDVAMKLDKLTLSYSNLLLGSGHMRFEEIVEDLVTPGVIAHFTVDLFAPGTAYNTTLNFDRVSTKIKVKKTIFLDAFDTQALDLAGVGLVEQKIETVPEPASMAVIGLGIAALAARRRRR